MKNMFMKNFYKEQAKVSNFEYDKCNWTVTERSLNQSL